MTAASHAVDAPSAAPFSVALQRLDELLSSDDAQPAEVHERLVALSDDDLTHYGLRAYRMNLMALFGERWSGEAIAQAARRAAISKMWLGWEYHHHYLPRLTPEAPPARLRRVPLDTIRSLLAKGRGLVIVTFHLGHMRYLPSDIAHAGIPVLLPLARDAYGNYESAREANPGAAFWRAFRYVCVEENGGTLALARTLAKGGCVFSTIDGNTGMDGPRGDDRRSLVDVLGTQARVKNGLIMMAARFGAPVLPVIAATTDGERTCHALPAIDPGAPLAGEAAEHFVEATVRSLYAWFGESLLDFAGEWCGGDLFHQWRIPRAVPEKNPAEVEAQLLAGLREGGRIQLDATRMMPLPGDGDRVFVDVQTMKCYRLPEQEAELTGLLLDPRRGVGLDWLDGLARERRDSVWRFLCLMASRETLAVRRDRASAAA
jgi:lauroyl/myristoyl acyltransferase